MKFKKVEEGIVPIYEDETKERLINARELFYLLRGDNTKTKFADWIKRRINYYNFIENDDFIRFLKFEKGDEKGFGNKKIIEYYLTMDTAKELCMVENNIVGRKIRKYFIEVEKRYRNILNNSNHTNQLIDIMQNAINYMRENNIRVDNLEDSVFQIELVTLSRNYKNWKSNTSRYWTDANVC